MCVCVCAFARCVCVSSTRRMRGIYCRNTLNILFECVYETKEDIANEEKQRVIENGARFAEPSAGIRHVVDAMYEREALLHANDTY